VHFEDLHNNNNNNPLRFNHPLEGFPWDNLCKIFGTIHLRAKKIIIIGNEYDGNNYWQM